ncbi:MAG: hypothetical protein LIO79_01505 [Rikenellaceae bacterium]|nr:hypothetical protein [Rikenellaceae bacterium]
MAKIIENPKTYTGEELSAIFFRPMLTGPDATELGIRIMYNMPVPTTISFWERSSDVLKNYSSEWAGSDPSVKYQKKIDLSKVKAELGFSAEDYFNMVYERLTGAPDVNLGDLSGTNLEEAETALFKEAVSESIRATMWTGNTQRNEGHNTFDGVIKKIKEDIAGGETGITEIPLPDLSMEASAEGLLKEMWDKAPAYLRQLRSRGDLVFLVTTDIYDNYEDTLDSYKVDNSYLAMQNGRNELKYKGIPIIDLHITNYLKSYSDMPDSIAILTDRKNLALAVNTNDFPGMEVKMWYNPDQIENRQRAVFMAGCDYLLPELLVVSYQ